MMEGEGDGAPRLSEELMQMNAPNFDVLSFLIILVPSHPSRKHTSIPGW